MSDISLFPRPQSIKRSEGNFSLNADTVICAQDRNLGETLASYLRPATGFSHPGRICRRRNRYSQYY